MRDESSHQPEPSHPFRVNRYPGRCPRCRSTVRAGQGALMGVRGSHWVLHIGCTTEEEWSSSADDAWARESA
jgi:hypothetical protein